MYQKWRKKGQKITLSASPPFGTLARLVLTPLARRFVLALWAVVCGAALTMSLWSSADIVRTEDQNHDGRPDVWRIYDRQGRLRRVDFDTNFDGRADRRDYYRDGVRTRSESDRNFDNQVDLIEEFDLLGHEHVRSVVDADFDGTADLLVLFQDGQPVHSEWRTPTHVQTLAGSAAVVLPRDPGADEAGGLLAALDDPFSATASVRAAHRPRAPDATGLTVPTVMLKQPVAVANRPGAGATTLARAFAQAPRSTTLRLSPARAPPLPSLS
jgi:hypothetical protein